MGHETSTARIRGLVVAASILAATVLAFVVLNASSFGDKRPGDTYYGLHLLPPGPATMGLPLIPVRVAQDGTLVGEPSYLAWYRYCQRQDAPGTSTSYEGPDTFTIWTNPEKISAAQAEGRSLWWEDLVGQTARADDFHEPWKGAPVVWRSANVTGMDTITVVVIRVDPSVYPEPVRSEFVADGFLAATTMDLHFCCTAGYEESSNERARADDGHSLVFDPCHDSRYDPREVQAYPFPPREVTTP